MGKSREITKISEILEIMDSCEVIRIAMHDEGGIYILPMNFGYTYEEGELVFYLHGAVKGKKLDLIRKNNKLGFELDCGHEMVEGKLPCQYGYRFSSVTGQGTAEFIEDPKDKIEAMTVMMKSLTGKEFEFNEKLVSIVSVIKLKATSYTARKRD